MSRKFRLEFSLETPYKLDHKSVKFFTQRILDLLSNDSVDWHKGYRLSLTSAEEINKSKCLDVHEDFVL